MLLTPGTSCNDEPKIDLAEKDPMPPPAETSRSDGLKIDLGLTLRNDDPFEFW